ncbi:NUMOD4 domain-containing protein [Priestia flexa]|uniref:NUMOD4 domain-containing protein n=1 Tax=Priestia flexa TaxID=86664 RepID=UPI00240DB7E7|nr:NUMOD4 domain-containing protein [Priestia flexa]WEZ08134.1 NUMOD4 domain-containing protein [Priestia flexa]
MKNEQWSKFEETETKNYFVSTAGRVKHIDKFTGEEFMMKPSPNHAGRKMIGVAETGKKYYVYRLVAEKFIPNLENKPTVNHIRGIDAGDSIENLEWMTYAEQQEHAYRIGLKTGGKTAAIVLDTNGFVIGQHDTMNVALKSCYGRKTYYNKYVQIIGNKILMEKPYYDELSEDEIFNICSECFEKILKFAYVVDGQLFDTGFETAEFIEYDSGNLNRKAKNKLAININGHEVSRFKNLIGVGDLS